MLKQFQLQRFFLKFKHKDAKFFSVYNTRI